MANRHHTQKQKRQPKAKAVDQGLTAYDVIFSGGLITGLGLLYGIFYL